MIAHHLRVVVDEGHQDVCPGYSHPCIVVSEGESENGKEAVVDEVLVQLRSALRLGVFTHRAAVLNELNGFFLLLVPFSIARPEDVEQVFQILLVVLEVVDNVNLVEKDEAVENGKGGVVEDARQHDVFEIEKSVGPVDLSLDFVFADRYHFFEL